MPPKDSASFPKIANSFAACALNNPVRLRLVKPCCTPDNENRRHGHPVKKESVAAHLSASPEKITGKHTCPFVQVLGQFPFRTLR